MPNSARSSIRPISSTAKRFNVEMKHLQRWNPRSKQALKPGQTLTLYLDTASR